MRGIQGIREEGLTICQTAYGWVGIAASPKGLLHLTLPKQTPEEALSSLRESHPEARLLGEEALDDLKGKLRRYFVGEEVTFSEPLDLSEATDFLRRVWEAARAIPYGQTRSYAWLAEKAGSPRAFRAAGQAMARNPLPIIVPCHRVVGSDGSLTGFGGGLEMKRRLLEMEKRAP